MAYSNPADAAMPYLQKIPGTITPYFQPYIDAGSSALNTLMGQYNTLLTNPAAIMNMAGSGFQASPGYQYQVNQGLYGANNAAAAGGMLGTAANQTNDASIASNLANQDYYNYLNHALGLYGMGLQGEQGINQMGFSASDQLADALAKNLMAEGGMAYAGQANQNQYDAMKALQSNSFWNTLGSTVGTAAGAFVKAA